MFRLTTQKRQLSYGLQRPLDYAIISALPEEQVYFHNLFADVNYTTIAIDEFNFKIYDYLNNKILIVNTGIGAVFAASIMTFIYTHFRPTYILISGCAGGIKKQLKLRDVIIATSAFEAEMQAFLTIVQGTPFAKCFEYPMKYPVDKKHFPLSYKANSELLNIANTLSFTDIRIFKGAIVSSDAFPAPEALFDSIKKLNPYAIDMETSAFYQTAWLFNAKVLAVRGISNILNNDGTDDNIHESDVKGSANAAASVLFAILKESIRLKKENYTYAT